MSEPALVAVFVGGAILTGLALVGALAARRALRHAQSVLGTVWLGHGCEQLAEPAPLWRSSLEAAPQGRQVDPAARTIVPPPVRLTVHRGER